MASKGKLTAALFEEQYGKLVSEDFSWYHSARTLRVALSQRKPPILVTDGMLKVWFAKYRSPISQSVSMESKSEFAVVGAATPGVSMKRPAATMSVLDDVSSSIRKRGASYRSKVIKWSPFVNSTFATRYDQAGIVASGKFSGGSVSPVNDAEVVFDC